MASRGSIPALTSIRFFAAVMVLLLHMSHPAAPLGRLIARAPWAAAFVHTGYAGVSLFFVLSGFVLTINYGQRAFGIKTYVVARLARVYPMYLFAWMLMMPFAVFWAMKAGARDASGAPFRELVTGVGLTVSLLQSWVPQFAMWVNAPSWSLSTEAFFYLVFPLLLPLSGRLRTRRALLLGIGCLWAISQLPMLAAFVVPSGSSVAHTPAAAAPIDDAWANFLRFNPLLRLPEFLIGVLTARIYLTRSAQSYPLDSDSPLLALSTAGLFAICGFASPHIPYLFVHDGGLAPLFACLVFALAISNGPITRTLSSPSLVVLGKASYILYIAQIPITAWTGFLDGKTLRLAETHANVFAVVQVVLLLGVSVGLYYLVEEPARRILNAKLRKSESQQRTAASGPITAVGDRQQ